MIDHTKIPNGPILNFGYTGCLLASFFIYPKRSSLDDVCPQQSSEFISKVNNTILRNYE